MTLEVIFNNLQRVAEACAKRDIDARWLVFGSILSNPAVASDVDVLIVYSNALHVDIVRAELARIDCFPPFHLVFLLPSEERELQFIARLKLSKEIWPPPSSVSERLLDVN